MVDSCTDHYNPDLLLFGFFTQMLIILTGFNANMLLDTLFHREEIRNTTEKRLIAEDQASELSAARPAWGHIRIKVPSCRIAHVRATEKNGSKDDVIRQVLTELSLED